jgi:hypothetical protein
MVATSDLMKGIGLWAIAMLIPLVMMNVGNPSQLLMFTLLYPNIIAFLSRSGRFWVSQSVVAVASIITTAVLVLLRMSQQSRDAMDGSKSPALKGTLLATILVTFFLTMALASMGFGMYGSDVLTSGEAAANASSDSLSF